MSLHTDGNAIAGALEEIFGVEVTATMRTCQSCGQERAIGSHRLYRGAGLVLRCPNCGDLAAAIAALPDDYRISLFGSWAVGPREELV
jgi:uncharacterized Zn finger protein